MSNGSCSSFLSVNELMMIILMLKIVSAAVLDFNAVGSGNVVVDESVKGSGVYDTFHFLLSCDKISVIDYFCD